MASILLVSLHAADPNQQRYRGVAPQPEPASQQQSPSAILPISGAAAPGGQTSHYPDKASVRREAVKDSEKEVPAASIQNLQTLGRF